MLRYRTTSDRLIGNLIVASELVVLNLALLMLFFVYRGDSMMNTPNCKRIMMLTSLIYIASNAVGNSRVQRRFVRGDQLLRNTLFTLTYFTLASLLSMWAFRWPLMTWKFMVPFNVCIWVFIILWRWVVRQVVKHYRKKGGNTMQTVFVGNVNIAKNLYNQMHKDHTTGYIIRGYFAEAPVPDFPEEDYMGRPEGVLDYLDNHSDHLHALYCMLPSSQNPLINQIMRKCDQKLVRYNHIPDSFNYTRHAMSVTVEMGTPIFAIHDEPLEQLGNRIIKRTFDIVFSGLFLLTVFPFVYLIFGALIKLSSPGPVLFRQKRSGIEGKDFYCLKFRSMKVNADSDSKQATKNDPRKTRIGDFMRKTSIDELPQFINVLMGDMSVVGPRPHMVKHTEEYSALISDYMVRHFAKPGITGYAQVSGFRGETQELWQMEERIKKDIWYIEHWTLALDLFIIFKTVANAVKGEKEAY